MCYLEFCNKKAKKNLAQIVKYSEIKYYKKSVISLFVPLLRLNGLTDSH